MFVAIGLQSLALFPTDLIDRLSQHLHNVKPIQHIHGVAGPLGDRVQIGPPHITDDILLRMATFPSHCVNEDDRDLPQRYELKLSRFQLMVIRRPRPTTSR